MYKMVSIAIFYCIDLGDDWVKAILDDGLELRFLQRSFDQSCECYQIGGSTNDTDPVHRYYRDDSGIIKTKK